MSPILVRPVREQLEHDRVIRLLQAKSRRRYDVDINPGSEQNTPVAGGPSPLYPDLVLYSATLHDNRLIEIYLGPGFPEVTFYVRLFAFGALPYAMYCVLRGVVDAFYLRAVNAINALIALGVFLLWTLVLWTVRGTPYVPIGLLVAVFVLGALTVFEAYRILSRSLPPGAVEVSVSEIPLAS